MDSSRKQLLKMTSVKRAFRTFLYSLAGVFFTLFFSVFSSSSAQAAPTVVTGTISGIPDGAWGLAWAEKYISGEWVEITSSYTKEFGSNFQIELGEATGSDVRIWARYGRDGEGYLSGTDSFTVTSTSMTKNFSLGAINVEVNVSNTLACANGSVNALPALDGMSNNFALWANINESGTSKLSLPLGYTFNLKGRCNGDISFTTSKTASGSLQVVPITIATPNITGTISGITSRSSISGMVQSKVFDGVSTKWQHIKFSFSTNDSGQFAMNLPQGTYRLGARPFFENDMNTSFVNSFSDSFTVSSSPLTINFTMSTTANLVFTVNPLVNSPGSWGNIEEKITHPLKGSYFSYVDGAVVNSEGKIRQFLPQGTYRITIYPNENGDGYSKTTSPEFTITEGGSAVTQTMTLAKANLKFIVSPTENAKWGGISLVDSDGNDYYGSISESGVGFIAAPAGTYEVTVSPGTSSPTAGITIISSLVVTGSEQTVNVTLAAGNVSGTVSPTTTSTQGWVYPEQKVTGPKSYWKRLNIGAKIDENGNYSLALSPGTYRIWAESNDGSFVRSPSAEFTVGSSPVDSDITLRSANITGTVSPTNRAAYGSVYVAWQNVDQNQEYDYWAPVRSDGTFKMALPAGTYKFKANPSGQYQNYFGVISGEVTVSSTPQAIELSLLAANVSGTVYPVDKSAGGYGNIEKLLDGRWEHADAAFSINDSGQYSVYLPQGTYRATVHPGWGSSGVFQLVSDSFTVLSGSNTFNFTLPSTNFSVSISPTDQSPGTQVAIQKLQSQGNFQEYSWTQVDEAGKVEAYLPSGRYRLVLQPSNRLFVETISNSFDMPASGEFPIPTSIALSTPNVSGSVTPGEHAARGQACIERKEADNFFATTCQQIDFNGKYGFKVPDGTYRIIVTPASVLYSKKYGYVSGVIKDSPYTVTTSDEFVVANNSQTIDIALSTGNLSGTVSDVAKSAGGWVQVLKTDGAYPQWTNYRANISELGTYALQLPAGKYRLQIFPREDATGVVRTETTDFTIAGSSVTLNVALDTPNLTGVISPIEKSAYGWTYAEQYSCKCGWSGWSGAPGIAASSGIKSDGSYAMKVDTGLTRVVAFPRYNATGVTKTTSDSFTVTAGNTSTVNFDLSEGNVRGTISSVTNSAGGYVRAEKKNGNFWDWTNFGTQILEDGTYRLQVDPGTYRLIASPGWRASGVVETPSNEFTVSSSLVTVNVTLAAPNLTGTVTNVAAAVDGTKINGGEAKYYSVAQGFILKKNGSDLDWINKYITIYADGSYSTYLPDGTYQIHIYEVNSLVVGLSRVSTTDIVVSGSTVFNFALGETNLRGTVTPSAASTWGWVCAEKQNGANWDWAGCETIRENGSFGFTASSGNYRLTANPRWDSVGYSKVVSDTVTVGSSGITSVTLSLNTANVKLVINDLEGRPNYNGYVHVKDSNGNYVDTGKAWISQLGKISFSLSPGTYTLEIQPANESSGVRTTTSITVPATGVLESTITLAAGNVQGVAKTSANANIACAFVTATATGETTVKTTSKNDGSFTLNLTAGVSWTISIVDPSNGGLGSTTLTPNGTSNNAVTVTTS
jgi:hypothetical protein